jgi:hypothetical protein
MKRSFAEYDAKPFSPTRKKKSLKGSAQAHQQFEHADRPQFN